MFWDNSYKWIDENISVFMKDSDGIQQVIKQQAVHWMTKKSKDMD